MTRSGRRLGKADMFDIAANLESLADNPGHAHASVSWLRSTAAVLRAQDEPAASPAKTDMEKLTTRGNEQADIARIMRRLVDESCAAFVALCADEKASMRVAARALSRDLEAAVEQLLSGHRAEHERINWRNI